MAKKKSTDGNDGKSQERTTSESQNNADGQNTYSRSSNVQGESAQQSNAPEPTSDDSSQQELSPEERWQQEQDELRLQQGLSPDQVPEQRNIRYDDSVTHSAIRDKLVEAGDPRGGELPAMGFEEHQRASSDSQIKKAQKESEGNARYFNGQKGWVNNPGAPDHGRAIGIVRVSEYASPQDELLDAVQGGRGKVKTYECTTRDGRAELLQVSAEHFRPALDASEWGKTPITTPIP